MYFNNFYHLPTIFLSCQQFYSLACYLKHLEFLSRLCCMTIRFASAEVELQFQKKAKKMTLIVHEYPLVCYPFACSS